MNKKGFTLIEMVVAIGILMVASTFILQIFMTSRLVNEKAYNLDQSVSLTTQVLESLKTDQHEHSAVFKSLMAKAEVQKTSSSSEYTSFYNAQWKAVSAKDAKSAFYMTCIVKSVKKSELSVALEVYQIKKDKTTKLLYTLDGAVLVKEVPNE